MTDTRARALLTSYGHDHWWHAGMRYLTRSMIGARTAGRMLDIGCGPGLDLQDLPDGLAGFGLDLERAPAVPHRFVIADGAQAPFDDGVFDVVSMLDVLDNPAAVPEHLLTEARRLLRLDGLLFVRVPAYQWLHSARDDFWGSARRYRRGELRLLVEKAGFTVRRLSYANCLLFAPAAAIRLATRSSWRGDEDMQPLPPALNSVLKRVLFTEVRWLRAHDLPFGLSLVCLATPAP